MPRNSLLHFGLSTPNNYRTQNPEKPSDITRNHRHILFTLLAGLLLPSLSLIAEVAVAPLNAPPLHPCGITEEEVDSPALERLEIRQLLKLSQIGNTTILYSHNNNLTIDAWKEIARTYKALNFRYVVEWISSEVYFWDNNEHSPQKKKEPMHSGHFEDLLNSNLRLNVYEPRAL